MITLMYRASDAPMDDRTAKKHLDRVKTWLTRRGIRGVWALEFTEAGTPHFHLLVIGEPDVVALRDQWAAITNQHRVAYIVRVKSIYDSEGSESYVAKRATKCAPAGYTMPRNARWHGTFGGFEREPAMKTEGTLKELAPVIRILRKIRKVRMKSIPRRDNGITGFTAWNLSPPQLTADIERYWQYLRGDSDGHTTVSTGGTR